MLPLTETKTIIFDVADDGVIETLNPVKSVKVVELVENVSVLAVLATFNTEPAGNPVVVAEVRIVPVASGRVIVLLLVTADGAIIDT